MKKIGLRNLIILVSTMILYGLNSCESNVEEDNLTSIEEEAEVCDPSISFAQVINPIITSNCTDCHGGRQFPDLRGYANVNRNASNIKSQVVSRRMPQGGSLTTEQIEAISCWVDSGALDN